MCWGIIALKFEEVWWLSHLTGFLSEYTGDCLIVLLSMTLSLLLLLVCHIRINLSTDTTRLHP